MKSNSLIYVDMFYPNKTEGETFLASEIEHSLLPDVDKYIFPVWGDMTHDKAAIAGFKIIKASRKYSKLTKLLYAAKAMFNKQTWNEIFYLKQTNRFTVNNVFTAISFIADCNYFAKILSTYILDNIQEKSKIVLYSYWLHWTAYTVLLVVRKLFDKYDFITVSRAHRFDVYEYAATGGYIPCRNILMSQLDYVCPISKDAFNYIQRYSQGAKIKLFRLGTFSNGLNISTKSKCLKILTCSWMRKVKRLELICEALKTIQVDIEWTHIGSGEEEGKIKTLAASIDNSHVKINFLGAMNNHEVMNYYLTESVNVFLNVSSSEGVPVSVMEAMSFGKIVIATNVGGTHEVIDNEVTGYLLNKDFEIQDLTQKLTLIASMNERDYIAMSQNARKKWEAICNAEDNYCRFNFFLRGLFTHEA